MRDIKKLIFGKNKNNFLKSIFYADSKSNLKISISVLFQYSNFFKSRWKAKTKHTTPVLHADSKYATEILIQTLFELSSRSLDVQRYRNKTSEDFYSDSDIGFGISAKNWFKNRYSMFGCIKFKFWRYSHTDGHFKIEKSSHRKLKFRFRIQNQNEISFCSWVKNVKTGFLPAYTGHYARKNNKNLTKELGY